LDFALLNTWKGWQGYSGTRTTLNQVVNNIKGKNPNIKIFQYTMLEQIGAGQSTMEAFSDQFNKVNAMNWWVYDVGTSGNKSKSMWQGTNGPFYEVNITSFAPVDGNGQRWTDWFANWAVKTFITPNPTLDGLYADSVSWFPFSASSADWNRDGIAESPKNAQTAQSYRQGYAQYFERLRSLAPGKLLIGNVANWGDSASDLTEYKGMLNGGLIEGMIGETWSIETRGGWNAMMSSYRKTMAVMADPKLVVFMQSSTSASDYQSVRYGLASCLMDDAYFSISPIDNSHQILWYDEFDAGLGQATTNPPTTSWQNGVYRRDFQNGIALVNPKGNGVRAVTLETAFKKLSGSQDSAVNSGQTVTTVTLKDRDGIILLRTSALPSPPPQAAKKPSPVPSVVVH
jgi:hypothetical protein